LLSQYKLWYHGLARYGINYTFDTSCGTKDIHLSRVEPPVLPHAGVTRHQSQIGRPLSASSFLRIPSTTALLPQPQRIPPNESIPSPPPLVGPTNTCPPRSIPLSTSLSPTPADPPRLMSILPPDSWWSDLDARELGPDPSLRSPRRKGSAASRLSPPHIGRWARELALLHLPSPAAGRSLSGSAPLLSLYKPTPP
jgi:hypothetical protein